MPHFLLLGRTRIELKRTRCVPPRLSPSSETAFGAAGVGLGTGIILDSTVGVDGVAGTARSAILSISLNSLSDEDGTT